MNCEEKNSTNAFSLFLWQTNSQCIPSNHHLHMATTHLFCTIKKQNITSEHILTQSMYAWALKNINTPSTSTNLRSEVYRPYFLYKKMTFSY